MNGSDVDRALSRIAHEVVERNTENTPLVVIGLQRGGVWIAEALSAKLDSICDLSVTLGVLDVSLYRDDHAIRPFVNSFHSDLAVSPKDKTVLLVDDVLYTGRTVRAALDAVLDFGRPKSVQLAVLIDRGHRELPIRPDFVGKNLPTSKHETVEASAEGVVIYSVARSGS